MNKFQKLYTKISNRLMPNPGQDPDMYNFLKEVKEKLVDKPTLEEIKQEWEARDYIWKETEFDIQLITKIPTYYLKIRIFKNTKTYQGIIDFQEHQLLTKTMKALGWI